MSRNLRDMVQVQYTRDLFAPVMAGETMGVMTYTLPTTGESVQYNLLATRTIPERTDKPLTIEQIVAITEADPNPFPPLTLEIVLIILSPLLIVLAVVFVLWLLFRSYRRLYARLPKNRNRYVK